MASGTSQHFDIVIVLDYYRSAAPLLCLIKAMSPRYRIGLLVVEAPDDLLAKAGPNQERFIQACLDAGAVRVEGTGHSCDLMVVQQRPYEDAAVGHVLDSVRPRRVVGVMLLAVAGLPVHERYLEQFGITKVYVPSERFRRFLVDRRGAQAVYDGVEVEQVGLPYDEIRLAPEVEADWIVATPTGFSFRRERQRQAFLKAVLRLLDAIDAEDTVLYKPHNGEYRDYLAPPRVAAIARAVAGIPGARALAALLAALPGRAGEVIGRLHTALLHERVLDRCTPLPAVTDRDWLPFEAFLPGIRKGVIGGLSNTIWGSLYFGLPFYNCVDRGLRDSVPETGKSSAPLLDLNLEFFGVAYCDGRIDFAGASGDNVVSDQDRRGSLLDAVETDLHSAREIRSWAN